MDSVGEGEDEGEDGVQRQMVLCRRMRVTKVRMARSLSGMGSNRR